jgi:prepilin-type N-terminal cleavage/methylation domain-containing protein
MEDSVFSHGTTQERNGRGFSLIEMMVASAIFAIAAAVAFILYSAAQKSYKSGENVTDQQQSTRVAFDRMISDIRLAGFNTNPDGDSTRIDEQVEGAWDTAVTVRGDFDFEDPAASVSPEAALPGAAYSVVSTGNDEIVTYVLAKPGPVGAETLTFRLDPDKPRIKSLKTVIVPNVVLNQSSPPYTLYRVSLADVTGTFPASPQAATNFVYEPVAENIRSMQFLYYDDAGALLSPNTPTSSADDIGGTDANALTRSRIRKISVRIVGMTQDEDLDYTDPTDATATSHYRKFDLASDVNPENLGKTGVRDLDVTPPASPTNISLVPGHCQGMLVKWDPPSSTAGVSSYSIKYWPNGSPSSFSTIGVPYPHIDYGTTDYLGHGFVPTLTTGNTYCFQVLAKDASGNSSNWAPASSAPCAAVTDTTATPVTVPGAPQNVKATGNGTLAPLDSQIQVTWDDLKVNAAALTGDPNTIGGVTILRDTKGYKLYRDTVSSFTPNDSLNLVANASILGLGAVSYTDLAVANCRTYYYKLVASDKCDILGAASAAATGQAVTVIAPSKVTGLVGNRTSKTNIHLNWTPVTLNVNGTTIYIEQYKVYRVMLPSFTSPGSISPGSFTLRGTAPSPMYDDTLANSDWQALNQGYSMYYVVSAADLCGNEGAKSDPVEIRCSFSGTISTNPADATSNGGSVPVSITISGGSDTYVRAKVRIPSLTLPGTDVYNQEVFGSCTGTCTFSFPAWDTSVSGGGTYTIYWEVENNKGCIQGLSTAFTATANLACQITPTNPNLSPTSGKPSALNKKMSWDVINNSGKNIEIYKIDVSWTNVLGSHVLTDLEFPTGTSMIPFSCVKTASTSSNATVDCSVFTIGLGATDNGLCGTSACQKNMSLLWDLQIVNSSNVGETVTVKYYFRDATSATGTCQFSVKPDLTIN